jgi:mannitol/fructose-specific phosphotransferase system IIA component
MTTNKQLIEAANKMAEAIDKLIEWLSKDGVAIDGFVDAFTARENWTRLKCKRTFEKWERKFDNRITK